MHRSFSHSGCVDRIGWRHFDSCTFTKSLCHRCVICAQEPATAHRPSGWCLRDHLPEYERSFWQPTLPKPASLLTTWVWSSIQDHCALDTVSFLSVLQRTLFLTRLAAPEGVPMFSHCFATATSLQTIAITSRSVPPKLASVCINRYRWCSLCLAMWCGVFSCFVITCLHVES